MKNRRAFTLIELLVVITIIAILSGIAIPQIQRAMTTAKRAANVQEALGVHKIMFAYASEHDGNYPSADDPTTPGKDIPATAVEVFTRLYENDYLPTYAVLHGGKTKWSQGDFTEDNLGWAVTQDLTVNDHALLPVLMGHDPNLQSIEASSSRRTDPQTVRLSEDGMWSTEGLIIIRNDGSGAFVPSSAQDQSVPLVPAGYRGSEKAILNPDA